MNGTEIDRLEKEYREFGPWILEIKSEEDIPDLFRKQYSYSSDVECALKIPIPMDRRQAKKGMDFYRSIVSFNRAEIIILEKSWTEITEKKILYKDIKAVKNMIDLLEASLTLFTADENFSIKYSSVSEEIINNVITILRKKYSEDSDPCRIETEYEGKITDQLFRNLISISGKNYSLIPLSFQKTTTVKRENTSIKDYLLFNFKLELQSYIFMRTEKELVAVTRNMEIKKKRAVDYSYNYTYIPFSNIEFIDFIPEPEFPDIYILRISLSASASISFVTSGQTKKDFAEIIDIYSY